MLRGRECARGVVESMFEVLEFIPLMGLGEHFLEEGGILDMNLEGTDTDDGPYSIPRSE